MQQADHPSAQGGFSVGYIDNGDWTAYSGVNTSGLRTFSARVSSGGAGGTIHVRSGSATGTLLGSVAVSPTGGWDTHVTVSTTLTGSASGPLYLVYTGGAGSCSTWTRSPFLNAKRGALLRGRPFFLSSRYEPAPAGRR